MKKITLIITSFLLMVLILAALNAFSAPSASAQSDGLVTTGDQDTAGTLSLDTSSSIIAAKFTKQINILSRVTLDDRLFQNPLFISLEDWSRPIPQEASGRVNPFAPF
jgi:hypothetical protein